MKKLQQVVFFTLLVFLPTITSFAAEPVPTSEELVAEKTAIKMAGEGFTKKNSTETVWELEEAIGRKVSADYSETATLGDVRLIHASTMHELRAIEKKLELNLQEIRWLANQKTEKTRQIIREEAQATRKMVENQHNDTRTIIYCKVVSAAEAIAKAMGTSPDTLWAEDTLTEQIVEAPAEAEKKKK